MLATSQALVRIPAVEDEPLLAVHLHEHLQDGGFDVALHQQGEEGLGLLHEEDFDLILMDVLQPWRPRPGA
ncbi:response regulator [Pseudomonas sp. BN411]|uniref:response regulator n=1 Tax=Pseudomonas sp. BN411 TaxID=2567887 RepID=UPI002456DE9F|nr:response regulator [Pseudomonas sp. BN411]MDH4562159.1 response regulator [Pseudomonas sp. BN411]